MEDYQNDLDMFQAALEIGFPWFVGHRELDRQAGQLHVYFNFKRGAEFPCEHCGESGKVHDIVNENRTWRHLDFWQYQTVLHARLPRIRCRHCDKITTVKVSWAREHASFSWLFEAHVMALMTEMPVAAVARKVGEHDTRLWRISHYYVERAMKEMDMTGVKRIALDETSSRRGHEYVTLFVDMDTKRVLLATEGKGSAGLLTFKQFLTQRGIDSNQIEEACCDMSAAFIAGIKEHFPAAQITFDKFHAMKLVNEAVDEVRREEQKDVVELKKTRYVWLKNESKLTDGQKQMILKLKDMNLQTGKAYRLKLALQDMWTCPTIYADLYFKQWTQWAVRSQVEPMAAIARSLQRYTDGKLRWFQSKMTNGLLEGINSLVQAAKRKARGYRSTRNFIAIIYATANKLKMTVEPH